MNATPPATIVRTIKVSIALAAMTNGRRTARKRRGGIGMSSGCKAARGLRGVIGFGSAVVFAGVPVLPSGTAFSAG
jgi:hypothetical protein